MPVHTHRHLSFGYNNEDRLRGDFVILCAPNRRLDRTRALKRTREPVLNDPEAAI
jgi:hypothetical protein